MFFCVFADCPKVTASGLLHLGSLTRLEDITLYGGPSSVVTDAVLDSLHSCSGLEELRLGDLRRPPETAIPAAAVSRSVSRYWRLCFVSTQHKHVHMYSLFGKKSKVYQPGS